MMYADFSYYSVAYGGTVPESEIMPMLKQSAQDVDTLTFGRIRSVGFENLSTFQQETIRECCCQMADFSRENEDVLNSCISSYSVNGASVALDKFNGTVYIVDGICILKRIYALLKQTGLCCQSESGWRCAIP